MIKHLLYVSLLLCLLPLAALAQTEIQIIYLKDGAKIQGKVLAQDDSTIVVEAKYRTLEIQKSNVAMLESNEPGSSKTVTVFMIDGKIIHGVLVVKDKDSIGVDTGYGVLMIPKSDFGQAGNEIINDNIASLFTADSINNPVTKDDSLKEGTGFFILNIGIGGESNAFSFGLGGLWKLHQLVLGGGGTFIFDGGEKWEPDPSYSWAAEFELYFNIGLSYRHVIVFVSIGLSEQDVPCGCGEWDTAKDNRFFFNYSAQIGFGTSKIFILGYHNRRGIVMGIGL